jgi:hypothetical protein
MNSLTPESKTRPRLNTKIPGAFLCGPDHGLGRMSQAFNLSAVIESIPMRRPQERLSDSGGTAGEYRWLTKHVIHIEENLPIH